MRKTTKGALAVGAGVALLLSGAGTLAAWQSSLSLSTQSVASGDLNLTSTGTATWVWGTASNATTCVAGSTAFVPGTSKLVPGDCVVFTQPIKVDAVGDNLKSTITVTGTPAFGTTGELSSKLNVATVATFTPATGVAAGTGGAWNFDSTVATSKTISATGTAKVTIIFDPATTGRVGAAQSTTITGVGLLLAQTAPTS
ncbi:alternate-type signal peptide domain-containing protein [Cellulomonas sp.]|uniref:alternate-type signal peptide domain-containing protein n=1 Tax=Cellulomonas sp. TaxID=40001 RepID=UPI003BA962F1